MSLEQTTSLLILAGGSTFVLGLLYRLFALIHGFDHDGREEMERMNAAHRLVAQEQVAALKERDVEGIPLFSSDLEVLEKALMKHVRTKVSGNSIPKALEQGFCGERGETCQPQLLGEAYLKFDRLVMTLKEESVR